MRDIDKAKELFNIKDYLASNYNSQFIREKDYYRIKKCPFCSNKVGRHTVVFNSGVIYSHSGCIKSMDAVALFQYEGLDENEAINKLLAITGITKDSILETPKQRKSYDFNKFYDYLVNEWKKRNIILKYDLKMSERELLKINLEKQLFGELSDMVIDAVTDEEKLKVENIKNNYVVYYNNWMKEKVKYYLGIC